MNTKSIDFELHMLLERMRCSRRLEVPARKSAMWRSGFGEGRWPLAGAVWTLSGLGLIVAVGLVIGSNGFKTALPEIWTHGIFALVAAQSAIVVGMTLKLVSSFEASHELLGSFLRSQSSHRAQLVRPKEKQSPRLASQLRLHPLPSPPPLPGGFIGARKFVQLTRGVVEIDTLLGRRRFASIEAAQEFVGGEIRYETDLAADVQPVPTVASYPGAASSMAA